MDHEHARERPSAGRPGLIRVDLGAVGPRQRDVAGTERFFGWSWHGGLHFSFFSRYGDARRPTPVGASRPAINSGAANLRRFAGACGSGNRHDWRVHRPRWPVVALLFGSITVGGFVVQPTAASAAARTEDSAGAAGNRTCTHDSRARDGVCALQPRHRYRGRPLRGRHRPLQGPCRAGQKHRALPGATADWAGGHGGRRQLHRSGRHRPPERGGSRRGRATSTSPRRRRSGSRRSTPQVVRPRSPSQARVGPGSMETALLRM